jgi:hypothetical protein
MMRLSCAVLLLVLAGVIGVPRPASAQEAAPEASAEEPGVPGFFRMDVDTYGLTLWAGATHTIGPVQIYSNVFLNGALGEIDVGPQLTLGNLTLTLTAGPVFDFATQDVAAIVAPFLTTVLDHPRFYLESWFLMSFGSPFNDEAEDLLHTRNFALVKLNETVWIGPQVELDYGLARANKVTSLPIGGQVNVGYGKDNRVSLFLGYETREQSDPETGEPVDSDRLAGRITFVRLW